MKFPKLRWWAGNYPDLESYLDRKRTWVDHLISVIVWAALIAGIPLAYFYNTWYIALTLWPFAALLLLWMMYFFFIRRWIAWDDARYLVMAGINPNSKPTTKDKT